MSAADGYGIIPLPRQVIPGSGSFMLDQTTRIAADERAGDAATLLQLLLRPGTGLALGMVPLAARTRGDVCLVLDPRGRSDPEAYCIDVTEDRIDVASATTAGLVCGIQTLRQLLPPDTLRSAPVGRGPIRVPCLHISDVPRFPWRGLLLDVARHFMPKPSVLRMIDLASLHRLNVLQLHLTDDQGWRLEVPDWPRLAGTGAWRRATAIGPVDVPAGDDGVPHGGYYSLTDLAEIAQYSALRNVTLVPEFGFPGHTQAAIAAYPQLGQCGSIDVGTRWGHSPHVLAPSPAALNFVRDVLTVVLDTFPSPYIHLGGDECVRDEWRKSPYAKSRARKLGLNSVNELQSWFLREGVRIIENAGRRAVGWDQVMEDGGVPASTIVMAWRDFSHDTAAEALAAGHDVVQCPTRTTYLDHAQSDLECEPPSFYGTATFNDVAAYDPDPFHAALRGPARVIGTQGHLWTEYMPTPRDVEYMAFPRLAAIAEAAWSDLDQRRELPLTHRMNSYLQRLDALSVGYRPLAGPHPWQMRQITAGHSDDSR
jgi:hexosaminidase